MGMKTLTALLLVASVSGCATDEDTAVEARASNGAVASAEPQRGLECDGVESAVADYFPNAPAATPGSVGEPTPESAALELLTFGRAFDPDAYEVSTSQAGRVTYSDAQGAVVAEVVVVSTQDERYVATEMQVCKSALNAS